VTRSSLRDAAAIAEGVDDDLVTPPAAVHAE